MLGAVADSRRRGSGVSNFVTRDPSTGYLMLSGQRYRFSGCNALTGGLSEDTATFYGATVVGGLHTVNHAETDAFITAAVTMNTRVIRSFSLLSMGSSMAISPTIGTYNAATFESVDYALAQCAANNIKVIYSFVDNYQYFTGGKYLWCTNSGVTPDSDATQFFTNSTVITNFKAYISTILDHVNQYTGVAYKNDPTILAWETGNELTANGISGGLPTLVSWTDNISQHIKVTKGAQQLVADGYFGIAAGALALTYVDIYSEHTYDSFRTPGYIIGQSDIAHASGKSFILGEYTWTDSGGWTLPSMITGLEDSISIDGDLYWDMSAPQSAHGGGYRLHCPGDDANQIARGAQLAAHALRMKVAPTTKGGQFLNDQFTAATVAPNVVVALGDSITDYASAYDYQPWIGNNWYDQLIVGSNQRMKYGGTYATGGFNLTQIRDTHVPQVLALNPKPQFAIIAGGTNDAQNVGSTYSRSYSAGVLGDIINSLVGAGITPILWAITPHTNTAANVNDWNSYIRALALSGSYPLLDAYAACSDGADGWLPGFTTDGLHPSATGMQAIANRAILDGLPGVCPANDPHLLVARGATDLTNMINDGTKNLGLFSVDTNGDGAADGFVRNGVSTLISLVAPNTGDDIVGNWQRLRQSSAGQQISVQRSIASGWVAGQTLAFSAKVRTQNILSTATQWFLEIYATVPGGFTTPSGTSVTALHNGITAWLNDANGLVYVEFVVPPGTSTLLFSAFLDASSGDPIVDFAEVTLRNLGTRPPAVLDTHVSDSGGTWAKQYGSTGVGTLTADRAWIGSPSGNYVSSINPATADYDVSSDIKLVAGQGNTSAGPCARMQLTANTMYMAFLYAANTGVYYLFLAKYVNGAYTELGEIALPIQPVNGQTHNVRLRTVGNQITAYWDGNALLGPYTDTSITAPGHIGIGSSPFSSTTGFHFDNITGTIFVPLPSLTPPVRRPNYGALLQV